jgi:hypothetical protein
VSGAPRTALVPGCCALGARNLEWFPRSRRRGAWHASSCRWDSQTDVPTSKPLAACPFCGSALAPPDPIVTR